MRGAIAVGLLLFAGCQRTVDDIVPIPAPSAPKPMTIASAPPSASAPPRASASAPPAPSIDRDH